MPKPDVISHGITNETEDGKFLVFLDYDGVAYKKVLKDIHLLMDTGYICAAVTLVNSEKEMISISGESEPVGNYNVLTFCKLGFFDCEEAIRLTRCDYAFKRHIEDNPQRNHNIRLGAKMKAGKLVKPMPKLKEIIGSRMGCCPRKHSRAHLDMVNELFGAKIDHFKRMDAFTEVEAVRYGTQVKKPSPANPGGYL